MALVDLPAGHVETAQRYEDDMLRMLGRHGARVERRLRTADARTEVHVLWFPSRDAYQEFLADPGRLGYLAAAAPTTQVLEVREV